jgi:hypothetical protein
MPPSIHTSEIRAAQWPARWCAWRHAGPFQGLEIIGVAPRTYSKTRSALVGRLRFGSQTHVVEWEWDGDAFVKSWSAADVPLPQSRALGALGDDRFVLYDWFTGRSVEIRLQGDTLEVFGPAGLGPARRAR